MEALLTEWKQVEGLVLASGAGEALESTGTLDASTLAAVATASAKQLRAIGELLDAGDLERWYVVAEQHAYYVSERPGSRLVAIGESVKSPEATSKALHQALREPTTRAR